MEDKKRTQKYLIIVAFAIFAFAIVWLFTRGQNSEMNKLCDRLNAFGYEFYSDDLLIVFDSAQTSISDALKESTESMSDAISASTTAGFSSDIEKVGGITVVLAADNSDTVTVCLVDGEIELCFVQKADGSIVPIGDNANDS